MLLEEWTTAQTFELYGPTNYSTREIADLVDKEIIKHRRHINLPKRMLKPVAKVLNKALWWPIMSEDEVEREFLDQKIDPTAKTFKDLGIEPAELSNLTFHYLVSGFPGSPFEINALTFSAARIPELAVLRSPSGERTRERGREEVCPCA
jgi:NADH dehydrogenase (ubiquinone) 1 alpha subcomplex subunit 9